MPETRIVETVYSKGGFDPTKPNNNIIEEVTAEISDEHLTLEQIERDVNEANDQALVAYQNYASLNVSQKDKILKALLGDYIRRHPEKYGG